MARIFQVKAIGGQKGKRVVLANRFLFYPETIPKVLKSGPWVCCDAENVPEIPRTRRQASSTDAQTCRTYPEAQAAYQASRRAGIGRVITLGDPYIGVDLDGVKDPERRPPFGPDLA
jgi:hypothetical protein